MSRKIMAAALNAVSNSSRTPISDTDVIAILATGDGPGHLVRALFGDCSFETLDRLGAGHGIARSTIRSAYSYARRKHAAVNDDLEQEAQRSCETKVF